MTWGSALLLMILVRVTTPLPSPDFISHLKIDRRFVEAIHRYPRCQDGQHHLRHGKALWSESSRRSCRDRSADGLFKSASMRLCARRSLRQTCGVEQILRIPEDVSGVKVVRGNGVTDGDRTHDHRNHNPALYQLSYSHHCCCSNSFRFQA